jgi:hypothetical protein
VHSGGAELENDAEEVTTVGTSIQLSLSMRELLFADAYLLLTSRSPYFLKT